MKVTVKDVQKVVGRHYGVPQKELLANRRHRAVVQARQIGMYLARQITLNSLPEIGRRFGGRDHTTVLHACRKIEGLLERDENLAGELALLQAEIELATPQEAESDSGTIAKEILAARAVARAAENISAQVAARLADMLTGPLTEAALSASIETQPPAQSPEITRLLAAVHKLERERYGQFEAGAIDAVIAAGRVAREAGKQ